MRPKYPKCDVVWPTVTGCRRQDGKYPGGQYLDEKGHTRYRFHDWMKAAGIDRHVWFHHLRHTCSTALLNGDWGHSWPLDRVQLMLGHSEAKTTERYAKTTETALQKEAALMPSLGFTEDHRENHQAPSTDQKTLAPPRRIELPANGLGNRTLSLQLHRFNPLGGAAGGLVERAIKAAQESKAVLDAFGAGEPINFRRNVFAHEETVEVLLLVLAELTAKTVDTDEQADVALQA